MNIKRVATIGVAVGALAAWLAAAATAVRHDAAQPAPTVAVKPDARGAALDAEVARLTERIRPDVAPLDPGRNLFAFREPKPQPAPAASRRAFAGPPPGALPPGPPTFTLDGLAENPGADGPVRTAIISGAGQLFLVKVGDAVTLRYRVAKIGADAVELTDLSTGAIVRLALK